MTAIPNHLMIERSGFGIGPSEARALDNWLTTDKQFINEDGSSFGINAIDIDKPIEATCTRQPIVSKGVIVKKEKYEGIKKKWVTTFMVIRSDDLGVVGECAKKAEAIKLAKEEAVKLQVQLQVVLVKKLVGRDTLEATVTPKPIKDGRYKFRASFKY